VTSLFTPLITGSTIVIYEGEEKNFLIEEIIDENKVGVVKLTPSHLYVIKHKELHQSNIKCFIVGGEMFETRIARDIAAKFNNNIEIYNEYGPTEATVGCLIYKFNPAKDNYTSVPVGIPIAETQIYLLDSNQRPVPEGVSGEIYVSGKGIARGYLNSPELTAEKFLTVSHRLHRSHRSYRSYISKKLYKTGDIGRWLPGGNIEFLGRKDHQVKIRGYRIELAEIEQQLLQHEKIKEAVVIARDAEEKNNSDEKQDQYLTAYFVSNIELQVPELREFLLRDLADYMVPLYFVRIDKIPLTSNGKIDKKALPVPRIKKEKDFVPPGNKMEKKLVDIWSDVLRIERDVIGIDTSFLQLGGQSLKQVNLISRIHKEFNVQVPLAEIFKNQTIRELAGYIKEAATEEYVSIKAEEEKEYYEISSSQKRMYVLREMGVEDTLYNVPFLVTVTREINKEKFEKAVQKLIRRHEGLRTSFIMLDGRPVQKINKYADFKIEYHDVDSEGVSHPPSAGPDVGEILDRFIRPFDLSLAPLFRAGLIKLEKEKYMMMLDIHHIISDGVSMEIISREFTRFYQEDENANLPEPPIRYKDYAQWQNSETIKEKIKKQEKYWTGVFAEEVPLLNLPYDYPRPKVQGFEGDIVNFEIGPEQTTALNRMARESGVTLYVLVITVFNVLLSKLGNQEDIAVGTPLAGRRQAELNQVVGMFVNTLVLRNYPRAGQTFTAFLQDVHTKTLQAFENQDYQFEDLLDAVDLQRDVSRNPLFDVMFSWFSMYRNTNADAAMELPTADNPYRYSRQVAKFDISWGGREVSDRLAFAVEYCTKLFKKETIIRFVDYFKRIISAVLKSPHRQLSQIEIISPEEKRKVLDSFNQTGVEFPRNKKLHELFEEQAVRTPDNLALVGSQPPSPGKKDKPGQWIQLTYKELNIKAHRLACVLTGKGLKPDNIVGIMLERSPQMIVAIFGVMKAGGAYLPINPGYPGERIKYMLDDGNVMFLIKESNRVKASLEEKDIDTILIDDPTLFSTPAELPGNPGTPPLSAGLAYVIYTSGSTGKPKGVLIEHPSIVNRLNWMQKGYPIGPSDVILQKTPFTFDVSVWELFWWSCRGASVCLLGHGEEKNPAAIIDAITKHNVSTMHFVPSMLNAFLEYLQHLPHANKPASLKQVFSSGEALSAHQANRFNQLFNRENTNPIRLINLYGPTEATVDVSYFNCPVTEENDMIPIGKPIDNIRLYVVTKNMKPQPVGLAGELCIAGDGLARGYLNRPELTAEKFDQDLRDCQDYHERKKVTGADDCRCINKKFLRGPGAVFSKRAPGRRRPKIYKTGDLARWLPDGNIEFLGRIDKQVKLRGFRIELGEIENQLLKHKKIRETVVVAKGTPDSGGSGYKNGTEYLCAYIVTNIDRESPAAPPNERSLPAAELKEYLSHYFPDFMIPSYFVEVEKIPLTPNGKIDIKALPEPRIEAEGQYIAPRNTTEEKLAKIWMQELNLDKVGIDDNFFDIGGNSVKIILVASQINKTFELNIPVVKLFRFTTIRAIGKYLNNEEEAVRGREKQLVQGKKDRTNLLKRRRGTK
jgi:amino acid adenylation domain-containing protein